MPRTSPLQNVALLEKALTSSASKKEVLAKLGLRAAGGNYKALKNACEAAGLGMPRFDYSSQAKRLNSVKKLADESVFVKDSTYENRRALKKRLLAAGVEERCIECGQESVWNGKDLTLQLEHRNGIWNDNRRENLCFLCPNCHSQTETYAGRGTSRETRPSFCVDCGVSIGKGSTRCYLHAGEQRQTVSYPSVEELVGSILESSFVQVGRRLGTSDIAVRKHLQARLGRDHQIFSREGRRELKNVIV